MDFEKLNLSLVFLVSGASYQASYKAPFVLVVKRTSLTTDSKEAYSMYPLRSYFIMNAPLVSCPFPVIKICWVPYCTRLTLMTGNGQLTRGAFVMK